MKTITYWKKANMPGMPGVTFILVPEQVVTSDMAFFERIVEAIKASDMDFQITETLPVESRVTAIK